MAKPTSFGRLEFKVVSSLNEAKGRSDPETPFRILIVGDFSGRANRSLFEPSSLRERRPLLIDRDNFDDIMAKLGVEIGLPVAGPDRPSVPVAFGGLEDFHPDRIFERLNVFQALRETKKRLADPRTFAAAAAEVRGWGGTVTPDAPPERPSEKGPVPPELAGLSTAGLLDEIIETTHGGPSEARPAAGESEWAAFLREVVRPHLLPRADPRQGELVAALDASIAALMRTILHHPDFQAIEAAWRGVHFLVSRLETDAQLRLYLLDVSKAELAADLSSTEDLRSTGSYRILVEQTVETPGGKPWAIVAGNFTFDQIREDGEFLGRMAKIAGRAGAPFIASAHPHLVGCESLFETPDPDDWRRPADDDSIRAWEELRKIPEASYLGLVLPRFLLRLPYGRETEPTEGFDFEELTHPPTHEDYLWGNPTLACTCLLGQAFSLHGWDLRPGVVKDIPGLPLHVFRIKGESRTKPCAEVLLSERAAESILDKGLVPLLSFRDQDMVRMARFQSLADPLRQLAGRWM
jgi:type VI secretion system protein ImpC